MASSVFRPPGAKLSRKQQSYDAETQPESFLTVASFWVTAPCSNESNESAGLRFHHFLQLSLQESDQISANSLCKFTQGLLDRTLPSTWFGEADVRELEACNWFPCVPSQIDGEYLQAAAHLLLQRSSLRWLPTSKIWNMASLHNPHPNLFAAAFFCREALFQTGELNSLDHHIAISVRGGGSPHSFGDRLCLAASQIL